MRGVGADASVGPWGPGKQEPRGRTICPERSGAEGETKAALMVLFTAHCSPRRGARPCGGPSSNPEP
jgi:hypothetical protein